MQCLHYKKNTGKIMNKLTKLFSLTAIIFALPSTAADMNFTPMADISLSGKIGTVKTSKKYRSVSSCQALCASKTSCAAFTLNESKGTCTILKSVKKEVANTNATSGKKS
jgi:hypothetical protein